MPNKNNVNNHKVTYKKSGVSIKQADKLIDKIKPLTKRTLDKNVLGDIGGFGALYDISKLKYKNPICSREHIIAFMKSINKPITHDSMIQQQIQG